MRARWPRPIGRDEGATDLREYHRVGLSQARLAFGTGMVFAGLGALVILAGAVKLFFLDSGSTIEAGAYATICGAISEAVAALLLMQANRANRRMVELFDRGRRDRDLATAQRIAERLPDDAVGVQLRAWLVFHLAGAADPDASTRTLLGDRSPSSAARPARQPGQAILRPMGSDNGLCDTCVHQKLVPNTRGSVFSLCLRSREDPRYARYPRVPVASCPGYEPTTTSRAKRESRS